MTARGRGSGFRWKKTDFVTALLCGWNERVGSSRTSRFLTSEEEQMEQWSVVRTSLLSFCK